MIANKKVKNPERKDINFQEYYQKTNIAKPEEKYRDEVPGENLTFTEENFIDFQVKNKNEMIKLQTYREESKINKEKPNALLFFMHGLNSHIGRSFALLAKEFSKAGITSVGFDQRGFGKSQG